MRRDGASFDGGETLRRGTRALRLRVRRVWGVLPVIARWGVGVLAVAAVGLSIALLWRAVAGSKDVLWERIQSTGVWRVGLDPSFPPFEQPDAVTGQPIGFDVELAQAIAARWGVQVEIVGVGFDQLIDAVGAKRVDSAVSALPVMPERTRDVAFSSPYVDAGLVVAAPAGSVIESASDLGGKRVAAEWGSSGDAALRALARESEQEVTLVLRQSVDEALAAVIAGDADAAVVDAVSLALFDPDGVQIRPVGEMLESDPYVIVLPVDAPKLQGAINEALAAIAADGTLDALKSKWFGSAFR